MAEVLKNAVKGNVPFWVCLIVAILLLVGGALTPPMFVIDKSIFYACSILFAFAMLYTVDKAIDKGANAKIKHKDTEIVIDGDGK